MSSRLCLYVQVCSCGFTYESVCVRVCVHTRVSSGGGCLCIRIHVWRVQVRVDVRPSVSVHTYVRVCTWTSVYVHTGVFTRIPV